MQEDLKKYDKLSIGEIEERIEKSFLQSRQSQKEMYEMLYYLYTTKRFKENPRYKKVSFDTYLQDNFNIRMNTFRENVRAFTNYSDFAVEYGAGLVTKIANICGAKKISKVISEIEKEEKTHKNGLNRAVIENIIQKNATPKIEKQVTDWKAMYEAEAAAHEATKQALRVAVTKVKELQDQVRKLKVTAQGVIHTREHKPAMRPAVM
jgi:predicted  nucleic acid-binding Zn-ribbon protein